MKNDPPSGVSGAPFDDDIMKWNCIIFGYVEKSKFKIISNCCSNRLIINVNFVIAFVLI